MKRYGAVFFQSQQVHFTGPSPQDSGAGEQNRSPLPLAIEIAGSFSPWVEPAQANLLLMDLSGLDKQWPEEESLALAIRQAFQERHLSAQVAIASNRATARLMARGCSSIAVVPPEQEQQRLATLPLQLLDPPGELQQIFSRWGLHTLGDLSRLPRDSLAQRLGEQGMHLYRQACGQDDTPLTPHLPEQNFEAFFAFDWPVENSQALAFTLHRLLEQLCSQLAAAALAAEAAELLLALANRTSHTRRVRFGALLNDPPTILSLLRLELESHPPEAAVASLLLRLQPAPRRPLQFSLTDPPCPAPEKLARTLARLAALVGEHNVGSPALLNTHRPDAFEMRPFHVPGPRPQVASRRLQVEGRRSKVASRRSKVESRRSKVESRRAKVASRRAQIKDCAQAMGSTTGKPDPCPLQTQPPPALRLFRPPLPAQVTIERHRPAAVQASAISGHVVECGGPWRSSGEWWQAGQRWAREEWDVLLSDGGLYRLYQDLQQEIWFVDGIYD